MSRWCPKPSSPAASPASSPASSPVTSRQAQAGNVLVVSLLLLLTLTLMGVGLVYVANSQINLVATQATRTMSLSNAESCVDEARTWLAARAATGLPTTPQSFNNLPLTQSGDPAATQVKMLAAGYSCTLEPLGVGGAAGASGVGAEVGESGVYGSSGAAKTYYFRVTAMGTHSGVTGATVEVILSVTQ